MRTDIMSEIYTTEKANEAIPITLMTKEELNLLENKQKRQKWLCNSGFKANEHEFCFIPHKDVSLQEVVVGIKEINLWSLANLPQKLPQGTYKIKTKLRNDTFFSLALGWGLGTYVFDLYKKIPNRKVQLYISDSIDLKKLEVFLETFFWIRDLINKPASDLTPVLLAQETKNLADSFNAKTTLLTGEDLLKQNYPLIYAVGKGSQNPPSFTEFKWGNPQNPKLALIGKGITFDTGGLNIKADGPMRLMKKDMAGAAHALGLARIIMSLNLPIFLHVLVPSAENAVSGSAMHPLDVIKSRKGLTVEIGHTDAEGRLVLADALFAASVEKPDLIIDFATLTGAARVALGPDLPAFFTNNDKIASHLYKIGEKLNDPLWRLPLFKPYKKWIQGRTADLCNIASSSLASEISYAGAITAALFLQEFLSEDLNWVHVDFMAWNTSPKPGRPEGGEVMSLRTMYDYLEKHFIKK